MSVEAPWYEEWFDRDEYAVVYRHRNDEEAEALIRTVLEIVRPEAGARILDMGCGRGRHAVRLAQLGFDVTGIDLSERSIEAARKRAKANGVAVKFAVSDMREKPCDGCFDGVINVFTAFGYFTDSSDHFRAISAMADAVRPGGWFVQDFLNADQVRSSLVPEDRRTDGDLEIVQRRSIRDGRIEKEIELRRGNDVRRFQESVRLFGLDELERLHRRAGLLVEHVAGDYAGGPFTPSAPRTILFSRKMSR